MGFAIIVVRQKNFCECCKKNNRWKTQNSHVKENCFYGDQEGWEKLATVNKTVENSYFVAFHDSGSTPRSYFKDIPDKIEFFCSNSKQSENTSSWNRNSKIWKYGIK